jgi:Lar family restriction alleviation protein
MSPEQIKDKLAPILTGPRILPDADYAVLRPCPFCGNYPDQHILKHDMGYVIRCFTCDFNGPWGATKNLAILAWNTRGGK